eukprot:387771-Amphidinium_carterae.1
MAQRTFSVWRDECVSTNSWKTSWSEAVTARCSQYRTRDPKNYSTSSQKEEWQQVCKDCRSSYRAESADES